MSAKRAKGGSQVSVGGLDMSPAGPSKIDCIVDPASLRRVPRLCTEEKLSAMLCC